MIINFFFRFLTVIKTGKSCPPTLQKRGCQGTSQCGTNKSTHHKAALKGKQKKQTNQLLVDSTGKRTSKYRVYITLDH